MINLLRKEFCLSLHPVTPFMVLSAFMVFIPNYPYQVIFFYLSLAVFFICLSGRENADVKFSLLLPVRKKAVVQSRILFAAILQIIQLAVLALLVVVRKYVYDSPNLAGMDANLALLADGFLIFGVFNLVFFCSYYNNVNKVGTSFIKSSVAIFLLVFADIIAVNAVPFIRDYVDNTQIRFIKYRMLFLVICIALYIILTFSCYKISASEFEKQDI